MDYHGYDRYRSAEATCANCSWSGLGGDLAQGDVFSELMELDCPECHQKVFVVSFPTRAETEDAAAMGDESATKDSVADVVEVPEHPSPVGAQRKQLSAFKFSKPPSEMTEEELGEVVDRILDQWVKDLDDSPPLES